MPRALPFAALTLALALAGCMGGATEEAPLQAQAAKSAQDAGAVAGEAPSAPKEAYLVAPSAASPEEKVVAYPVAVRTNPAKAPVEIDLSGTYEPGDCRPFQMGELDGVVGGGGPNRFHEFGDAFAVGDVFSYEVVLAYNNTDQSWAEIHPVYGIGSTAEGHNEATGSVREPIEIKWVGQGYRASLEDMAWISVNCWYGQITAPIPYTLTVRLSFAEAAIPAQAPMVVPVPEAAKRLFVGGVPIDASKGVLSHFRVFTPDDELLCECALSSDEQVATVELPTSGEYVILVDHTDNGFVSLAFDAPPAAEVRPATVEWLVTDVLVAEGGPVDQVVEFELPTVPLLMHAWVQDAGGAGAGKKTVLDVTNERGPVLRIGWGGHMTWANPAGGGQSWIGVWPADWEYEVDHHAFAGGAHTAHVSAEYLRGSVQLITRQYLR